MWKGLAAGTVNAGIAIARGAEIPHAGFLLAGAMLGLASYGVSLAFFVTSLREIGTARTGAYFSTAPFIGALLSVLVLHETVTLRLAIAGALMLLGVWLHLTEMHEHAHTHEALAHAHAHRHDEHHRHDHQPDIRHRHEHP